MLIFFQFSVPVPSNGWTAPEPPQSPLTVSGRFWFGLARGKGSGLYKDYAVRIQVRRSSELRLRLFLGSSLTRLKVTLDWSLVGLHKPSSNRLNLDQDRIKYPSAMSPELGPKRASKPTRPLKSRWPLCGRFSIGLAWPASLFDIFHHLMEIPLVPLAPGIHLETSRIRIKVRKT